MTIRYRCRTCDLDHEGLPTFGPDAPAAYDRLDAAQRERAWLGSDQCEIGDRRFLRALLPVPIVDAPGEELAWLVWVEISRSDYQHASETWETVGRERTAPVAGTLAVALPYSPITEGLRVELVTMPVGQRPHVRVLAEHPLRVEQERGIELAHAIARAEALLHPVEERAEALFADVRAGLRERYGPEDEAIRFDSRAHAAPAPVAMLDVFVWRRSGDLPATLFATIGMAARPMPGTTMRAEVLMSVGELARAHEMSVATFLANVASYPWDIGAALDHWHTFGCGGPVPRFPTCDAVLVREPLVGPREDLETRAGAVRLLQVVPITAEERALGRQGRAVLEAHLARLDRRS